MMRANRIEIADQRKLTRNDAALDRPVLGTPRDGIVTDRQSSPHSVISAEESVVFVIDDDPSFCDALSSLFRSVGLRVQLFGSARELLQSDLPAIASCLVLDIRLPGLSGLDLQAELADADIRIPIVFITGHGDIPMSVQAMKAGAVDFLTKPFRDQDMLDAVRVALERDRKRRNDEKMASGLRSLFESLTPRERQVMAFVTEGLMNKQIAGEIGISEITVKIHRGNVMRKMSARSVADLVRMADLLGVRRARPR
jgi:FixJ family two-component response regulator